MINMTKIRTKMDDSTIQTVTMANSDVEDSSL